MLSERQKIFLTHDLTMLTMTRQSHGKIAFLVLWDRLFFYLIFPVTLVGHGQGHGSKIKVSFVGRHPYVWPNCLKCYI